MAITVGMLLGILPKTSFLCVLLGLLCVVLPAHLPMLVLTAVLVSFVSPLLQPALGSVGLWSLTNPNLSAYWLRLDSMPLVPWLGIHNTVVNGSLCAWLLISVPVYVAARIVIGTLFAAAMPDEIANIILTAEGSPKASILREEHEIRPLAGLQEPGIVRTPIAPPVVIWDDINHDQSSYESDTESELPVSRESNSADQIIHRSAELAAWAEELITEELLMDDRTGSRVSSEIERTNRPNVEAGVDDEERWLIETTMEMVRIAERAVTNQAAMKAKQSGDLRDVENSHSPTQENSQIQTVQMQNSTISHPDAEFPESTIRREQMPHTDHRSHLGQTRTGVAGGTTNGVVNRPREEALHYLLRHLKGVQEKAQKQ